MDFPRCLLGAAILLPALSARLHSETFTMTGYYPSPSAAYAGLTASSSVFLATRNGNVGINTTSPGATPLTAGWTAAMRYLEVNGFIGTEADRFVVNGFDDKNAFWFKSLAGINANSGETGTVFFGLHNVAGNSDNTKNGVDYVDITAPNGLPAASPAGIAVGSPNSAYCQGTNNPLNADCIWFGRFPFIDGGTSTLDVTQQKLQTTGEFFTNYLHPGNTLWIGNTSGAGALLNGTYVADIEGDAEIAAGYSPGTLEIWNNLGSGYVTSNAPSDLRLKKNIVPIAGALGKIDGLNPARFEWKDDVIAERHFDAGTHWGLVAQEVEKVLPELVDADEAGYKRVRYGAELNMLALAALKELQAENAGRRDQIDRQQARIDALKAELKARGKKGL